MMKLFFKCIRFKNFMSYGGLLQEVNFIKGLTLITGTNGVGKSTILEVLSYNLTGVPYRKMDSIKMLLNDVVGKNLYTESEFDIDGNSYRLVRCMSPDSIVLYKNGKMLDLQHSKKLIQEYITGIIGINQYLFRNVIALAITNNTPFLTMGTPERRKVIDNIFGIKVFTDMTAEIKRELVRIKSEHVTHNNNYTFAMSNSEKLMAAYKAEEYRTTMSGNRMAELRNIIRVTTDKIKQGESVRESKVAIYNELVERVNALNMNAVNMSLYEINREIGKIEYEIKSNNDRVQYLLNNDTCDACGQHITKSHKDECVYHAKTVNDELIDNRNMKMFDIEKSNHTISECNRLQANIAECSQFLATVDSHLNSYRMTLNTATSELEYLSRDCVSETLKHQYESTISELAEIEKNVQVLAKDQEVHSIAVDVLSDKGIRSYFISRLTPMINSRVAYYINIFELPVSIVFDSHLEPTLTVLGKNRSYGNFSEGEKKRIDVAIYMAFIDANKMVSGWDCNLLVLDEILDSSLDSVGYENMLKCVKQIVDDSDICGYIISHREESVRSEYITNSMMIYKVGEFSDIN